MSLQAFRGVGALRMKMGPGARLVLYALADHHNGQTGLCCPGQAAIAVHAGLARRSVQRCIDELVSLGLIAVRDGGGVGIGERKTDAYTLLFPLLTGKDEPATLSPSTGDSVSGTGDTESHKSGSNQEEEPTERGASREMDSPPSESPIDYKLAVDLLWKAFGEHGRRRSSKPDTEASLRAAIGRRPASESAEDRLRKILTGVRAYLLSDEARKDDGQFQKGVHRLLAKDRWQSWLDQAPPAGAPATVIDPQIGTDVAPGPQLQALWAELASQGMPWNPERGPRPGMPGCRISDEIQRQYGFEPWAGTDALAAPATARSVPNSVSVSHVDPSAAAAPSASDDDLTAFL